MNLKSLPELERPREKMLHRGKETLSLAELMAIVMQSGSREDSALILSQKILHLYNPLHDVSLEELMKIKGIGLAKASQIVAAIELGKRVSQQEKSFIGQVNSPGMVKDFFQSELTHQNREHFIVVFLNTKNKIMSYETISIGSLNASIVHPREVFQRAIKKSAASILLIHNHPSGSSKPSREDHSITKRLSEVGQVVGIQVLDHIILAGDEYFSFKEQGNL